MEKKSNAQRFIQAYNQLDHSMRTVYGFKRNMTFADVVRRAVSLNSVIRKYEEDLIDYGRLRNSIVHRSNPNYIIAEPHDDVVQDIEKIAKLISTPPLALERVCSRNVLCFDYDTSLKAAIELIASSGFNNVPIYKDSQLLGVATGGKIIRWIGEKLVAGKSFEEIFDITTLEDVIKEFPLKNYRVANRTISIETALNMFYVDRKLDSIIITKEGTDGEMPLGIITAADVLDMNEILENY